MRDETLVKLAKCIFATILNAVPAETISGLLEAESLWEKIETQEGRW